MHEAEGVVTELTPEQLEVEKADMVETNYAGYENEGADTSYLSTEAMIPERLDEIEMQMVDAVGADKEVLQAEKEDLMQRRADMKTSKN